MVRVLTIALLAGQLVLGLIFIFLFALQTSKTGQFLSAFSAASLVGGAAAVTGGFFGLLFALPKSLQGDVTEEMQRATNERVRAWYKTNTSLEQVSDWLTKLLLGAGLTQLGAMPGHIGKLAEWIGPALQTGSITESESEVVAGAIVVYALIVGFVVAYCWTRFYMVRALEGSLGST